MIPQNEGRSIRDHRKWNLLSWLLSGVMFVLCQVMVKLKRIHGHMSSVGGSFWDLGAGVGKLVIAASMMHNFEVRQQS